MMIKSTFSNHKTIHPFIFSLALLCLIITNTTLAQSPSGYIASPSNNSFNNSNIVEAPLEITWHLIVDDMELGKQSGWQVNIPYIQLNNTTKHWMAYLKELDYLVRKKRSRQGNYFFAPDLKLPSIHGERANVYTYFEPYLNGVSLKAFFNINGQFLEGNSTPPHLQQAVEQFLMDFAVGEYAEAVKAIIAVEGMHLMELEIENNQLALQLRDRIQQMDRHQTILADLERAYQDDLALQADNTNIINQKVAAIEALQINLGQYGEQVNLNANDYLANNNGTAQPPYPPYNQPSNNAVAKKTTPNNPTIAGSGVVYPPATPIQKTNPKSNPTTTVVGKNPSGQPTGSTTPNYPYPSAKKNSGWNQGQAATKQTWKKNTTPPKKTTTNPPKSGQAKNIGTNPSPKKTTAPTRKTAPSSTKGKVVKKNNPVNKVSPPNPAVVKGTQQQISGNASNGISTLPPKPWVKKQPTTVSTPSTTTAEVVAGSAFLNAQGQSVNYLDPAEKAMVQEINLLRSNPKAYVKYVEQYIQQLDDPNSEIGGMFDKAQERAVAYELIAELRRTPALPLLVPHKGVYAAAQKHGLDVKQRGQTGHQGSDGSYPDERVKRAAPDMRTGGENIVAGLNDIRLTLLYLLVDNGIPNRGHRKTLLAANWTHVGVYRIDGKVGNIPYCWVQNFGEKLGNSASVTPTPPPIANRTTPTNNNNWTGVPQVNNQAFPSNNAVNNGINSSSSTTIKTDAQWLFLDETATEPMRVAAPAPLPTPAPVPAPPTTQSILNTAPSKPTIFSNNSNAWGTGGLPASDYSNQKSTPPSSNPNATPPNYPWLKKEGE